MSARIQQGGARAGMADGRETDDPKAARDARLKAALKANMARRKGQARDAAPNHQGRRKADGRDDG